MTTVTTTLFIVGLSVLGATISGALIAALLRRSERVRLGTRVSAALGLLPMLVGLAVALAFFLPSFMSACHCTFHGGHHPHLCLVHPESSWLTNLGAALTLAWATRTVGRGRALFGDLVASAAWTSRARRGSALELCAGMLVHRVHALGTVAATVGSVAPIIVVDDDVWASLGPSERRAVVLHEEAHALRRDGLMLLMLRIALLPLPDGVSRVLVGAWSRSVEFASDAHARAVLDDGVLVAQTLLVCSRLAGPSRLALGFGASGSTDLSARVEALLDDRARPSRARRDLVAVTSSFFAVLALASSTTSGATHHIIETAIGWLV